jgi:hypothetical protein
MGSAELCEANVIIVMAGEASFAPIEHSLNPSASIMTIASHGPRRGESTDPTPQQKFPPLTAQASNLFQSVVAFVGDGCALVEDAEYRQRLRTCHACDRRNGKRCTACGCWIALKARGRAFTCPLSRWEEG